MMISDLVEATGKLTAEHGPDLYMRDHQNRFVIFTPGDKCGCSTCLDDLDKFLEWSEAIQRGMIFCPDCGNKRCPRATDHKNDCTASNEPGQTGSIYGERL